MAVTTLLSMVKSILSDMDSDDVAAIADSDEAGQVASIIKDVYYQMVMNKTIPEHKQLVTLFDAQAGEEPTLRIDESVSPLIKSIDFIYYDKRKFGDTSPQYGEVNYLCPEEFIKKMIGLNTDASDVYSYIDPTSGVTLLAYNDQAPRWYTSFDDEYLIFNAWDNEIDSSGLLASKTLIHGTILPTWTQEDAFIPDIDEMFIPLLLAEAKSTAFVNLKQQANAKIEKQARQQKIAIQNDKYKSKAAEKAHTYSTQHIAGRKRP